MNGNSYRRKEKAVEEAFRFHEEGKRLSYIAGKFPEYESEIREIFGIAAFIKENKDKILPSKNVLKTILSKLPGKLSAQDSVAVNKKEIVREIYNQPRTDALAPNENENESKDKIPHGKIKIVILIIIIAIIWGVFLFRKDSRQNSLPSENNSENLEEPSGFESGGQL